MTKYSQYLQSVVTIISVFVSIVLFLANQNHKLTAEIAGKETAKYLEQLFHIKHQISIHQHNEYLLSAKVDSLQLEIKISQNKQDSLKKIASFQKASIANLKLQLHEIPDLPAFTHNEHLQHFLRWTSNHPP